MSDISMCQHAECPKAETCWRFNAQANEYAQLYFEPESVPCANYWPVGQRYEP